LIAKRASCNPCNGTIPDLKHLSLICLGKVSGREAISAALVFFDLFEDNL